MKKIKFTEKLLTTRVTLESAVADDIVLYVQYLVAKDLVDPITEEGKKKVIPLVINQFVIDSLKKDTAFEKWKKIQGNTLEQQMKKTNDSIDTYFESVKKVNK